MEKQGSFNKKLYNIFNICQEFGQCLSELQRLKSIIKSDKQEIDESDVRNTET
ncbi:MAG: hypothetical protein RLZZ337_833 [Bacteroidota bacterium]|jgi:ABC-type bacteriocin/lantibiotic exporter with double-glycine peptidase domain